MRCIYVSPTVLHKTHYHCAQIVHCMPVVVSEAAMLFVQLGTWAASLERQDGRVGSHAHQAHSVGGGQLGQ